MNQVNIQSMIFLFENEIFGLGGPMSRTKRHVTTTPYPTDKRAQQRDQGKHDGYHNRNRRRPCTLNEFI